MREASSLKMIPYFYQKKERLINYNDPSGKKMNILNKIKNVKFHNSY